MDSSSPPTHRVVSILDELARDPVNPRTVSQLARSLGISTSTCHAIVTSLTASEYLVPVGRTRRYALGPRVIAIGRAAQMSLAPPSTAGSLLRTLSDELGYVCSIRTKVGNRVVVLDLTGEPDPSALMHVGDQYLFIPPFGLSFVLWGSERTRDEWIARAPAPIPIDELNRLALATASSRRRGYAVHQSLGETRRRLHGALVNSTSDEAGDESLRSLLAEVLKPMWIGAFLLDQLDSSVPLDVASISAPIYDVDGYPRWIVEVHGMGIVDAVGTVEQIGSQLAQKAAFLTESSGGIPPKW